jgi:DNA polymerase III delta subunit
MIYIIHGEDTASSRKKLNEILENSKNVMCLEGKKATLAEIDLALISDSMFEDRKTVLIEHFSKLKPQDKFLEILNQVQNDNSLSIILWDVVEIPVKFKKIKSQSFSYTFPKVYFQFMDSLTPKSSHANVSLLRDVLKTYEPEQVLYSIIKRLRQLLLLKSENYHEIAEFSKMQDWQLGRLRAQSNKWTEDQLKSAFLSYTNLDEKIKTSGLTMDLAHHLDILLLSDLN